MCSNQLEIMCLCVVGYSLNPCIMVFMKLCFDQRLVSNLLMLMVPSHTIEIIVNTSFLVKKNI